MSCSRGNTSEGAALMASASSAATSAEGAPLAFFTSARPTIA